MTRKEKHISEDPDVLGNEGHPVEGSARDKKLLARRARAGSDEDSA